PHYYAATVQGGAGLPRSRARSAGSSVPNRDELPPLERRAGVVGPIVGTTGQLHLGTVHPLVRNLIQQKTDTIEPRLSLVVRAQDVPRRVRRVSRGEHLVTRTGVVVPVSPGLDVHRAQLPLPKRVFNPRFESLLLLLLAN